MAAPFQVGADPDVLAAPHMLPDVGLGTDSSGTAAEAGPGHEVARGDAGDPPPAAGQRAPSRPRGSSQFAEPPCSCKRLRVGVRNRCARFERWTVRCNARSIAKPGEYADLLQRARQGLPDVDEQTARQVTMDVDRTCPSLSFFSDAGGREMLTNILLAWVVLDADITAATSPDAAQGSEAVVAVGYVQGMSFIAMNLLWHSGREEAAFLVFVAMMQQYDLQSMFEPPDMKGLRRRALTATTLLRYSMPELSDHLAEYLQNSLELLLTDWLLTLFASSVAIVPLAELWDRFFEIGYGAIYRLILARLRCLRPWLLHEKDFAQLTNLVRSAHVDFDRIEGRLVPRLRGIGEPGTTAGGGVNSSRRHSKSGGDSSGWRSWGRLVFAPAAWVSRRGSEDRCNATEGASGAVGEHSAAWICHVCNGSEDCESWLCLVTELSHLERAPADLIQRLEEMFGADLHAIRAGEMSQAAGARSRSVSTTRTASGAPSSRGGGGRGQPRSASKPSARERPAAQASPALDNVGAGQTCSKDDLIAQLRAEVTQLRQENQELRRHAAEIEAENAALRGNRSAAERSAGQEAPPDEVSGDATQASAAAKKDDASAPPVAWPC